MRTQRFLQIRELFDQALSAPEEERERFLIVACDGDAELLGDVQSLFEAKDQAGAFLKETSAEPLLIPDFGPVKHPERVGPYRLIRELGRGGMGVVFLAVRDDGTFTKKVALKIILEGIRDREALGRFRAERQVLAGLDHLNIARILDAGDTEEGAPYYVMEYVEGEPLDAHCNRKNLGLDARLRLFQQVCSAVNYLHCKQVLHRDLKPNNILITTDGVVKLLDFGIAKFLGLGAIDLTTAGHAPLTPAYASPEQLTGTTVGPAADVYSLGVVLFRLLTDKLPNRLKIEPPSQALPPSAARMKRRISGDLDMILLKALALDPDNRYPSPEEFSSDLERFLGNRTVLARQSSLPHRISKLLRRNRVRSAAATVVLVLIAVGSWLAIEALRQRRDASAKEAQIQRLLDSIAHSRLSSGVIDPQKVEQIIAEVRRLRAGLNGKWIEGVNLSQGQVRFKKEVLDRSRQYLSSLQQISERNSAVAREVGYTYFRLGEIEQGGQQPQASDRSAVVASFTAAARTLARAADMDPQDADLRLRIADVEHRLAALGAGSPGREGFPEFKGPETGSAETGKPLESAGRSDAAAKASADPAAGGGPVRIRPLTAPVIEEFRADLASVRPGGAVKLHWTVSRGVSSVWLEPVGSMPRGADNIIVSPTVTTNYILRAMGDGPVAEQTLPIKVIPYVLPVIERLEIDPKTIVLGQSAKLMWSTSGDINTLLLTPGHAAVSPMDSALDLTPEKTTEYTLQASGPAGTASKLVKVEVVLQPDEVDKAPINNTSSTGSPDAVGRIDPKSVQEAERAFSDGQLKLRSKRYEEAAVLFGTAARLNTNWKDPLVERGKIDNKLGRFRAAIDDFNQALLIDPADAPVLNLRGHAHQSLNQGREARADFDEAIRLKPDLADAYLNRGNLKWQLGDKAGANADFDMSRLLRNGKVGR